MRHRCRRARADRRARRHARMVKLSLAALLLVASAACQGQGNEPTTPPVPKDARIVTNEPPRADAPAIDEPVREPEPVDPGKLIADLGAISAWQAVIDRAQYLARRGQHGVVYGTLGGPIMVPGPTPELPADAGVGAK